MGAAGGSLLPHPGGARRILEFLSPPAPQSDMDVYPLRFSDLFMERACGEDVVWSACWEERCLQRKRIGLKSWEVSDQPGR